MSISKFIARRFNRNNNLNVVSSQEGLPAAKPVATANARRRNRSINLNVENCEERVVPVVMASILAGSLTFLAQEYAARPFLDNIFGDSTSKHFAEIKKSLAALQSQVTELQNSVNISQFNNLNTTLKISTIDEYWGQLESALAANVAGKPWSKSSFEGLVNDTMNNLSDSLKLFDQAFAGTNGVLNEPLMKVFSNAIKGTVSVSKDDSRRTTPFLSSNYSTRMAGAFNYYLDEKAKAMILLANAYEYSNQHDRAKYAIEHFASPYATNSQAKAQWASELKTMPKFAIPDFMMVDTGTNRAWSQFDFRVVGPDKQNQYVYSTRKDSIPDLFAIQRSLNNKRNEHISDRNRDLRTMVSDAVKAEIKSGLTFHWQLPTQIDLGNQREFYTSRGFSKPYNANVWIEYNGYISSIFAGGDRIDLGYGTLTSSAVFWESIHTGDFYV